MIVRWESVQIDNNDTKLSCPLRVERSCLFFNVDTIWHTDYAVQNTFIWLEHKALHTASGHGPNQTYRNSHRAWYYRIYYYYNSFIFQHLRNYCATPDPLLALKTKAQTDYPFLVSRKQAYKDNLHQPSITPSLHNMKLPACSVVNQESLDYTKWLERVTFVLFLIKLLRTS